jgi:hypothetical protein
MCDTGDTVRVKWAEAATSSTDWVALSCVDATVLVSPVWVAFTRTINIALGMSDTALAIQSGWAGAANTSSVTGPNIFRTGIPGPQILTHAESISVKLSIFNTLLTITSFWTGTFVAPDIAWTYPDRTVDPVPVQRTCAFVIIIELRVLVTGEAVTRIWSATSITDWVTDTSVITTVISLIVGKTDAHISIIKLSVIGTVVTVTVFWPVALVIFTLQVTRSDVESTVLFVPVVVTDALIASIDDVFVGVLDTLETVAGVWSNTAVTDWMAWCPVFRAVISAPELLALTVSVIVQEGVFDTL